jgi:hypothetical protein
MTIASGAFERVHWRGAVPALAVAYVLLCAGLEAEGAVRLFSVQEFNAESDKVLGAEIRVEGRVAVIDPRELRFRNCDMRFIVQQALPVFTSRLPNVEVTGQVVREQGRLVFHVRSLREVSGDMDVFYQKRREVRRAESPEKWYELGIWAERRGEFYKDQSLLGAASEAFHHGLSLEHRTARDSPAGLRKLLDRDRGFALPDEFRQQVLHEIYVVQWRSRRGEAGEALQELAEGMARELPGAAEPAEVVDVAERKRYLDDPLAVYEAADADTRRRLNRLLYADVLVRLLRAQLAKDGGNGFEVADKLDKLVPEEHALAESLRDKALAARSAEVGTLSRSEVLALADKYRARSQTKQAADVIESWLTLRRRRLDPNDVEGFLQNADEYRTLLDRPDAAARMLIELHKRHPEATEIVERLQKAGYRQHDGQWLTAEQFAARPEGQIEKAIREGRVETGMTAGQVRRALGEPLSLSRALTAGEVTEIWGYGRPGSSRLIVRLVRTRRQQEATVVDFGQAP